MKPYFSLALGTVLLSSVASAQVPATELPLGTSYQGELDEQSDKHWNDGTYFQRFTVCATDTHAAGLYQLSSDIPLHISLFDAQQQLINRLYIESGQDSTTLLLTPPEGACRNLVISAQDEGMAGPFELAAQATTADANQLSASTPYLAKATDWDVEPGLNVEEVSQIRMTLIDSSRSLYGRLINDSQTLHLDVCESHSMSLNGVLEPGEYHLRLNREPVVDEFYGPMLYDYCNTGLVDTGDYFAVTAALSALPDGLRNEGEVQANDQLMGILSSTENTYQLSLTETSRLEVHLQSEEFDTVLTITGDNTHLENDDWGDGTNSALFPILEPGDYAIGVRSWSDSGTGLYDLTISSEVFDGSVGGGGAIAPGESLEGLLSSDENLYLFSLSERSTVVVSMDSDDFDAFLELYGPNTDLSDDDGGEGLNARITTVLDAGEYSIVATSYSGSGTYTLTLEAQPFDSELISQGTLRPGDRVMGRLDGNDELNYELIIETAGQYRIDVRSDDVDAYLTLIGDTVREEDDDGGEGTDACLTLTLQPGEYLLIATTYFGSTHGLLETQVTAVRGRGARGC
ncbi:MAG: hypothetical protein LAT65_18955 [Saccharospirillum sp.]|nr:hypothetical protein [Saccharospirillum sp.]